jgi:hypothetical protein
MEGAGSLGSWVRSAARAVARSASSAASAVKSAASSAYNLAASTSIPFTAAVAAAIQCGNAAYQGSKKAAGALVATYNAIKSVGAQAAALYELGKAAYRQTLGPALAKLADAAKVVGSIAPYVQAAIACVPVIGTGVSAALGAAAALAQGKSITDAMIAAAAGMVPGGAIAAAAVRVGAALCTGARLDATLLGEVRRVLPPLAATALDVGVAFGAGRATQAGELVARASLSATVSV